MDQYRVIGVMSGTSLDGLDMACCTFWRDKRWRYEVHEALTIEYPALWKSQLAEAMVLPAPELARLHVAYGRFIGQELNGFLMKSGFHPDFIASHGHTVHHRPQQGYTLQIGDGNAIAAATGLPVIYDFRSRDVALGGQGAPLVPIGDMLLFGNYGVCLNLGGIANLSFESGGRRIAFDISPANMLLNHLSAMAGMPFDAGGRLASRGRCSDALLEELDGLDYYKVRGSKTLGREWFQSEMVPVLNRHEIPENDLLRTAVEHIARQVAASTPTGEKGGMLVTGGGAHNTFLMETIRKKVEIPVIVPGDELIDFKEALVFAFLGVLRMRGEVNCLASVTGASRDSCGGIVTA